MKGELKLKPGSTWRTSDIFLEVMRFSRSKVPSQNKMNVQFLLNMKLREKLRVLYMYFHWVDSGLYEFA